MKCPKCGTDVKSPAKFCPECGTSLETQASKEPPSEVARKKEAEVSSSPPPDRQSQPASQASTSAIAEEKPAPKKRNTCLIVVVILLILLLCCGASVAGLIYGGKYLGLKIFSSAKEEAYKATCQSYQRNMKAAIMSYYAEKGTYPTSLNELVPTHIPKMYTCPSGGTYTYDPVTQGVRCSIKGHTLKE